MRIVFEDGVCEDIDAERIAESRYRLLATPLCSSSVARLSDIVELRSEGDTWRFQRVVDRSPLETLELLVTREIAEASDFRGLLEHVHQIGGEWEQAFGGVVFLHLPPDSVADLKSRLTHILDGHP